MSLELIQIKPKKVRKFQNSIQDFDIPIKMQDERLSSLTAKNP